MARVGRAIYTLIYLGMLSHPGVAAPPTFSNGLPSPVSDCEDDGTLASTSASLIVAPTEQSQSESEIIRPTTFWGKLSKGDYEPCSFATRNHIPRWSVSAGAIFLHRSRPDSAAIVTPPTGTPGVVINGMDFGFDWNASPDLTLMHRSSRGLIWEGRYFGDYGAEASSAIPNITNFRAVGIGITILGGGSINGIYRTKLNSSEINVHKAITDRITVLGGFRWVEIEDKLRLEIASPTTFLSWEEQNRLYGGQVGTNVAFTDGANPFRLNLTAKAGAYGNVIGNQFSSNIVSDASDEETDIAFIGELRLSACYSLTKHIAILGGYQTMWLDNVALASDAAAITTQVPGGTASPVPDGRLFYNGALAAIEIMW